MTMNRRRFLATSASAGIGAFMIGSAPRRAFADDTMPEWVKTLYDAALSAGETQVIYYPTSPGQEKLIETFRATFPDIELQYKYTIASELTAIVDAEFASGKRTIDVLQGGPSLQLRLRDAKRQEQFDLPEGAGIPQSAIYNDSKMFANGRLLLALGYNTTRLQPSDIPESIDTLLDDASWRSRIAMQKPVGAGAVDNALATLYGNGFITAEFVDKLVGIPTEGGNVALNTALAQGKYDAVLWSSSPSLFSIAAKGGPIRQFIQPRSSVVQTDLVSMLLDPPHPHAARLFLGWFLSRLGQAQIPATGIYSIYDDIPPPPDFPDVSTVVPPPLDPAKYVEQSAEMRKLTVRHWP